ncbi:MAG TPA: PAC2 family protein [Acidimicrobiales bacterium]|jgi:predicted ATP-grasp superfamily ATP-dependent carboligase|nr:PAC2 family protein [Acidimicrobiales bacterium]
MEHVRWSARPTLRQPTLVAAFAGWNDAGDASTSAVRYLADQWDAEPVAEIDAEEFFDFTETRPCVELVDGITRQITWPSTTVNVATAPGRADGPDQDVVLLLGTEPQLRWRTFCRQITDIAFALGVEEVMVLGALLAEVPHSRPVPITGSASDPATVLRHGLRRSRYQGPTGIVGVLHDACNREGLATVSLWATVPSYVPGTASPRAALALVERATAVLDTDVDTTLLAMGADRYLHELDQLVAADDDSAAYVRGLEERVDGGAADAELTAEDHVGGPADHPAGEGHHPPFTDADAQRVADEVERFLRERPDEPG